MPQDTNDNQRKPTDAEVRSAFELLFHANMYARRTAVEWSLRKNKPTKDELLTLANDLMAAEEAIMDMFKRPPGDGSSLTNSVRFFAVRNAELTERDRESR